MPCFAPFAVTFRIWICCIVKLGERKYSTRPCILLHLYFDRMANEDIFQNGWVRYTLSHLYNCGAFGCISHCVINEPTNINNHRKRCHITTVCFNCWWLSRVNDCGEHQPLCLSVDIQLYKGYRLGCKPILSTCDTCYIHLTHCQKTNLLEIVYQYFEKKNSQTLTGGLLPMLMFLHCQK